MPALPDPLPSRLPRWRGFNLTEMFMHHNRQPWREEDFAWMAEWGFNFARLPVSYWCWTPDPSDVSKVDETWLGELDRAVALGTRYGIHINLNLHRAPGYTVAHPPEARDLWTDLSAQEDFANLWGMLATRFRGVDNRQLSFDLVNEPAGVSGRTYARVVLKVLERIRDADPTRLVIADGLNYGREPVPELAPFGIAQSTRGYEPMTISHHQANWVKAAADFPAPAWPQIWGREAWDVQLLKARCIDPWKKLESLGVGVHVGEFGAHNRTPHRVVSAWMRDLLSLWRDAGWGWALWNFRGSFGIVDSGRTDIAYEDFQGHKLDREMLSLLQQF